MYLVDKLQSNTANPLDSLMTIAFSPYVWPASYLIAVYAELTLILYELYFTDLASAAAMPHCLWDYCNRYRALNI